VFEPTDSRVKWDLSLKRSVDGEELSRINSLKIIYDGDMDGAMRLPYEPDWFEMLEQGRVLHVTVLDYSSVGGPQRSTVRFDLKDFCP